ncbi:MAG TPA: hypothetical protein VGM56_16880 [Byssovorax sp.]
MRRALLAAAATLAVASFVGAARANGAFPSAAQIVPQPGDPSHVVLRATFGVLPSRDGGATFDWICEAAANYGSGQDPGIAVTGDGSIIAGVFGGLSAGHGDACDWTMALPGTFLVDVTIDRAHPSTAYTLGSTSSGGYFLWRSDDDAQSWNQVGPLPANFYPSTVDVAPSNSMRIYAGGGFFVEGGSRSSLARSDDGGLSWSIELLPPSATEPIPYIAGIDPFDADVVWVRPFTEPGTLLVTRDGGGSFDDVLTLPAGDLVAFAIAPDGHAALAGGTSAGLYYADLTGADAGAPITFTHRSDYNAGCLAWTDAAVLACGDSMADGSLVASSHDEGMTFAPTVPLACVRGPVDCPASSAVATQCTSVWPQIEAQIHHDTCVDGGEPATSSSVASTGATESSGAGLSATSTSSTASGAGGGGTTAAPAPSSSGCSCGVAGDAPRWLALPAAALACLFWSRRRNRRLPRA